jgi:hypothetical protein
LVKYFRWKETFFHATNFISNGHETFQLKFRSCAKKITSVVRADLIGRSELIVTQINFFRGGVNKKEGRKEDRKRERQKEREKDRQIEKMTVL